MFIENIFDQSAWFILACLVLALLSLEAALNYRRSWAVPALVGYGTVAVWYLVEPLYTPNIFDQFGTEVVDSATFEVIEFVIFLRIFLAVCLRLALRNVGTTTGRVASFRADKFLYIVTGLWIVLAAIGIYRMDGDVIGALLPLSSRSGSTMWARGAAGSAGSTGFLVAAASYIYTFVCASFGMLLPFLRRRSVKVLAILLIIISWPYFLLNGSRNTFLAVFLPSFASYVLFSRQRVAVKALIGVALFMLVSAWFHTELQYRTIGFESLLESRTSVNWGEKQLGLNMMSELCFENRFYNEGLLQLDYGVNYLAELMNIIPRAIWPGKPLIGIEYAMLRGFGGGNSDLGVYATISTGLIGQGFVNFGPLFGPMAAALLFSAWLAILTRFRRQQSSVLRRILFLLGLGLTFNLGRDITFLVLWPMVFAYVTVRMIEKRQSKGGSPPGREVRPAREAHPVRVAVPYNRPASRWS